MSATMATPLAVRTGLARSCGSSSLRCSSGSAAMISTSLGTRDSPYFSPTCLTNTFKSTWRKRATACE